MKSIKQKDQDESTAPLQDDGPIPAGAVKALWTKVATGLGVRDGEW